MADAVKQRLVADCSSNSEGGGKVDVEMACHFIDAVSALSPCSELHVCSTKEKLQGSAVFQEAYSRVVDTLLSTNCEFRSIGLKEAKVRPIDRDICLSLYDTITGAATKTKVLNVLSNRVARTMLYGDEEDVAKLTSEMQGKEAAFLEEWVGLGADAKETDECLYYESLLGHLTGGLDAPAPRLAGGGFSNAYQRFMTLLVQELGTRPAPVDDVVFDSFVRWESSLRKNLTQSVWDPHPKELTGQWTLMDLGTSSTGNSAGASAAAAASNSMRISSIGFRKDGTLRLPAGLGLDGWWSFEPGPTHLDTIRFEIRLGTPDNRVLAYTGYIDRGQRIETRFSKREIKMKGRRLLKVRGEARASSKFTMMSERRNKLGLGRLQNTNANAGTLIE